MPPGLPCGVRRAYVSPMPSDPMIRKQVGRPDPDDPLARLERLNRSVRGLLRKAPHADRTDHVRKTVGRPRSR